MISVSNDKIEELILIGKRIEELVFLTVFKDREKIIETAISIFGTSSRRAEIYLTLDGKKSATEIASELTMKRPNVSIEIGILYNSGLIEQVEDKKGSPYRRRICFEIIGLSQLVKNHFNL